MDGIDNTIFEMWIKLITGVGFANVNYNLSVDNKFFIKDGTIYATIKQSQVDSAHINFEAFNIKDTSLKVGIDVEMLRKFWGKIRSDLNIDSDEKYGIIDNPLYDPNEYMVIDYKIKNPKYSPNRTNRVWNPAKPTGQNCEEICWEIRNPFGGGVIGKDCKTVCTPTFGGFDEIPNPLYDPQEWIKDYKKIRNPKYSPNKKIKTVISPAIHIHQNLINESVYLNLIDLKGSKEIVSISPKTDQQYKQDYNYGKIEINMPVALAGSGSYKNKSNLNGISCEAVSNEFLSASLDLPKIIAELFGLGNAMSGNKHYGFSDGISANFSYILLQGSLVSGFAIKQVISFEPKKIMVTLKSESGESCSGLLGETFRFTAPLDHLSPLRYKATFKLIGTLKNTLIITRRGHFDVKSMHLRVDAKVHLQTVGGNINEAIDKKIISGYEKTDNISAEDISPIASINIPVEIVSEKEFVVNK